MNNFERLAQQVQAARKDCNITQRELAILLGCDFTYISRIESGRMSVLPSADMLTRMAQALNIEPAALLIAAGKVDPALIQELAANDERIARLLHQLQTKTLTDAQWQVIERVMK